MQDILQWADENAKTHRTCSKQVEVENALILHSPACDCQGICKCCIPNALNQRVTSMTLEHYLLGVVGVAHQKQ